jgi:transposase
MLTGLPICYSMACSPPVLSRERRQQDLRDLTRLRVSLVQERARLESSVHKVRGAMGCQLSAVLSDILGLSGKRILQAVCAEESDPMRLARLMHPGVKATQEQVIAALTAEVREHHRFVLRELLERTRGPGSFDEPPGSRD